MKKSFKNTGIGVAGLLVAAVVLTGCNKKTEETALDTPPTSAAKKGGPPPTSPSGQTPPGPGAAAPK